MNYLAPHFYRGIGCCVLALISTAVSALAHAQGVTYNFQYADSVSEATAMDELSADGLFGEKVSYVEGSTEFAITDVVAKTNVKLPLVFGRKLKPFLDRYESETNLTTDLLYQVMGTWEPDIPVIRGVYPTTDAFVTGTNPRCSTGAIPAPPSINIQGSPPLLAYNFWNGFSANIPGYGTEEIQTLNPSVLLPTDGNIYKYMTLNGWRVSCVANLKNGVGEGYLVTLSDGATYQFDWLAKRPITPISVPGSNNRPRVEMLFYATKATDRFGNTLTYTYDVNQPNRLQSIVASDGAAITIQYDTSGRISSAITAGRTWKYEYQQRANYTVPHVYLSSVTLPDLSKWALGEVTYAYGALGTPTFGYQCNYSPGPYTSTGDSAVYKIRFTHPAGAIGEFFFKKIAHGYNNLPGASCTASGEALPLGRPKASVGMALIRKTIEGSGVSLLNWTVTYSPSWTYESECTSGCTSTATTVVSTGGGKIERFTYGNDFKNNANQLLKHEVLEGGQRLRLTEHKYLQTVSGQPFGDYAAGPEGSYSASLENSFLRRNRPRYETRTYQDGVIFVNTVTSFDQFVRPTAMTRASSPGAPPSP